MVNFVISGAEVQRGGPEGCVGEWWVIHPTNGAILAYCDSENEAHAVVSILRALGAAWNRPVPLSPVR
jgi:hypothetical protein